MSSIVSTMSAPTRTSGDNARSPTLHRSSPGPVGARLCLLPRLLRPRRHDRHDRSSSLGARVPNRQCRRRGNPLLQLFRLLGGHYAPFTDMHEYAFDAELSFLR